MSDNTEIANNGMGIYIHRLFELADEFMKQFGDDEKETQKNFREMIFYAADRIKQPDNDDIEGLDNLFNAYVRLCVRYHRLPTIQCFSWLAKISRTTFNNWENGVYRSSCEHYLDTIKNWKEICKSFVIDELTNNSTTHINLIFVAKSAYGLRETTPVPIEEQRKNAPKSIDELPTAEEIEAIMHPEVRKQVDYLPE